MCGLWIQAARRCVPRPRLTLLTRAWRTGNESFIASNLNWRQLRLPWRNPRECGSVQQIEVRELQNRIAQNSARIANLAGRLPPGERDLHQERYEYQSMWAEVATGRAKLDLMRSEFRNVIASANGAVRAQAAAVQNSFAVYANEFLLEDCRLEWSPVSSPLGQGGRSFEFPAIRVRARWK